MVATRALDITVGDLVTEHPGYAGVLGRLDIDFCCGGRRSLRQVCRDKGLDPDDVLELLEASEGEHALEHDCAAMGLAELVDHIEGVHHDYLMRELPRLTDLVVKVARTHGERDARLAELERVFFAFMAEIEPHMMKEEHVLFPAIRDLAEGRPSSLACGIGAPIGVMQHEHEIAGGALARMRALTDGYTAPPEACTSWRALLDGLAALEADTHRHIHEENNILFPRALERATAG